MRRVNPHHRTVRACRGIGLLLALMVACRGPSPVPSAAVATDDDRWTRNQIAVARLYGVVRYFDPADTAVAVDWDAFARSALPVVSAAADDAALAQRLRDVFGAVTPEVDIGARGATLQASNGSEPVWWQHIGAGLGDPGRSYDSLRVHRPVVAGTLDAGAWLRSVDAGGLGGGQLRISAIFDAPSAGANGMIRNVWLPDGSSFSFTGLRVTRHDGRRLFALGIEPDVLVEPTIAGIVSGRDEVLDAALALFR